MLMSTKKNSFLILLLVMVAVVSAAQPEVTVKGKGYEILDGAATWPDSTGQSFGVLQANIDAVTKTYWVHNIGDAPLNLSNFRVTAAYSSVFNITDPTTLVVTAGDSVSFDIEFSPIAAGTYGRNTGGSGVCVAAFDTDDANEPTYDFRISGVALTDDGFDCSKGRLIFSHLGGGTDLKEWNYGSQPPTLTTISNAWTGNHDGMGINPNDNYIYAMRYNTGKRNQLWVFSRTGLGSFVGYVSGGGITNTMGQHASAGAMDNNNNLYAFYNADATSSLKKINVRSQLAESIILSDPVHIRSAIYNFDDGLLYGFSAGATHDGLVSVDPRDGTVTYIGGDGDLTYAAMFQSTDGAVYMMSQTYSMYLVNLTDGSIEQIGTNPGWSNGVWVDGCACGEIKAEADVNITIDDDRPSYTPGTTQTYTITVKNNGPWGSYRDTVRNSLPTGITEMNWTSIAYGTAISDNASGTGALEDIIDLSVGDSIVYIVRVTIPPLGFSDDLINTASVTASTVVSDPDISNNSSTDTDIIFSLSSEQCDNGFDDDGDGDVDCFDSSCFGDSLCSDGYYAIKPPECQEAPPVTPTFNMVLKYRSYQANNYTQPLVADVDGDGLPEIFSYNGSTQLYLLNGEDGSNQTTMPLAHTTFSQGAGIADINRDGYAEIYIVEGGKVNRRLHKFDHTGTEIYSGDQFGQNAGPAWDQQHTVSPSFADFNEDGNPEIYMGNNIFDPITGKALVRGGYNSSKGTHMAWWHQFSVAYDILPDGFCSDCDGVELICGNTVYSVNNTTFALTSIATHPRGDGYTGLVDINKDGKMDVIVVSANNTGPYVYAWDPRTGLIVPTDSKGNSLPAFRWIGRDAGSIEDNCSSLPTIADFDGDGENEIGIVSSLRLTILEPDLSIGAVLVTTDNSGMTNLTAFDFEGDGETEIVYRDETNLRILKYDTISGSIITKSTIACGSNTRNEGPVIADLDADGEAEICVACNNGGDHIAVFESDTTRSWMPTRKVWNQHNYVPIWVNDNLTIPAVFQDKNTIPGQDVYLAQSAIIDSSGSLIFPALPDFVASVDSIGKSACEDDSITVYLSICNDDAKSLIYGYPVSFYNGDPTSGGTFIGKNKVTLGNTTFTRDSCYQFTFNIPNAPIDLQILLNDNGSGDFGYPSTVIEECDSSNNLVNATITTCPLDAEITKDDGELHYIPGGARTYEIIARNNGPSFIGGIVSDPLPAGISAVDVTWTATTYGGASTKASGTMNGALRDTVDIPGGDSIMYSVTISTPENLTGDLVNVVSINVVGDTIIDNNTATDTDTVDCTFSISGVINSSTPGWTQIGTVVEGFKYNFNHAGGTRTFTAGGGSGNTDNGQTITTVIYNTTTNRSVSLSRNRYNNSNVWLGAITGYHNTPHAWTRLAGGATEKAPVLGFMGYIDLNGNGLYDTGIDEYLRDINSLSITPPSSGELYMAFYDNGSYADNNGVINIDASIDPATVDLAVSDTLICDGDSVQLDAGNPGALSWEWSNGETTQTIQAKETGEYSVLVTTPGGCTAKDTMNLIVGCETDLEATKTDGLSSYTRGANTVYTIVAKNNGPLDVENATVSDLIPIGVSSFSWNAVLFGTASNTSGTSGSGAISDNVDLKVGDSIIYTVTAAVSGTKYGDLINTVTIITPIGTPDSDSTNNIAIDIDTDPDPSQCFIMMTDFEDYVNCPSSTKPYDDFTAAYAGNSAWVNSALTAGLFVNDLAEGGSYDNIPTEAPQTHADGGTAYAGLHSPLSGKPTSAQEVIIGELPTNLVANQEYEISFIGISILVRDDPVWDNYAEVDFFGIEDGTNPVLNDATQTDWTTISAIPEVDHLGTSATIDSRTEWNEYSFKFTPTRDIDRLLLAPRGNWAYVGIDNIIVKVAAQTIEVDTVAICIGTTDTILPYTITSGNPTDYAIDWDDAANTVGIADVVLTALPVDSQFVLLELASVPSGTYTAEITAYNTPLGCESVDSILFIVDDSINVKLRSDTVLCFGDSLFLDAGNTENSSWSWNTGDTTQVIYVDSTGMYIVNVTNFSSCPDQKDTINVTVNSLPLVNIGGDTSICSRDSILFEGPSGGSSFWNTDEISSSITTDSAGIYHLTHTDTNNCINSDTVILTIDTVPDVNLRDDTTFCEGGSINIDAKNPDAIWAWNIGENSQIIDIDSSGTYKVIVSNTYNCVDSDSVKITVKPLPIVNIGPKDTSVCVENLYELDAGNTGAIFDWLSGEDTQTINPDKAGIYAVKVTLPTGCFSVDTIKIDTFETPTPNLNVPDTTICEGNSVEVTATPGLKTYSWTNDTSTSNSAILTSSNKYVITVTSVNDCVNKDSLTLTVNPRPVVNIGPKDTSVCIENLYELDAGNTGAIFDWTPGGEDEQKIKPFKAGLYAVKVTLGSGCFATDTIKIDTFLTSLPNLSVPDTSICADDSVKVTATPGLKTYSWSNDTSTSNSAILTSSNKYVVTVTSVNNCVSKDSLRLTVNPLPILGLNDSSLLCLYGELILSVDEIGATYEWSTGQSKREITVSSLDKIWVKVTTPENCELSDTTIVYKDTLIIDLGENTSFCSGDSALIDAGDFTTEVWNSSDTLNTYTSKQTETVTVLAINSKGCFGRDTILVSENPKPAITLKQKDSTICDLINQTTNAFVLESENMEIIWSTGENGESTIISETGWTIVTKMNEFDCSIQDSVFIDRYCEEPTFNLPNIFTPDGDGTNETFVPIEDPLKLMDYFKVIQFTVYNRWGRVVYMSRGKLPYWKGVYQDTGNKCPSGTYFWIVDYQSIYDEQKKLNGHVELVGE